MNKKEIIEKIKFMEMALEHGEELNLMCRPSYGCWGDFGGLELFFLSNNMTEETIIVSDSNYYVVLRYDQIKNKQYEIKKYIESFCHCYDDINPDNIFNDIDTIKECKCKFPTQEEAEDWWHNDLLKKIEERSKFIKEKIGEV